MRLDNGENDGQGWASRAFSCNFEEYSEMPKEKAVRRFGLIELLDKDQEAGRAGMRDMCIQDVESDAYVSQASI